MKPYDEFETFRALAKRPVAPQRYAALDDLHRTLYGTLHPSAERIGQEDFEEMDREVAGVPEKGWIEENGALTAAIAIAGAALVYALMKKKPDAPLKGPADPLPPSQTS